MGIRRTCLVGLVWVPLVVGQQLPLSQDPKVAEESLTNLMATVYQEHDKESFDKELQSGPNIRKLYLTGDGDPVRQAKRMLRKTCLMVADSPEAADAVVELHTDFLGGGELHPSGEIYCSSNDRSTRCSEVGGYTSDINCDRDGNCESHTYPTLPALRSHPIVDGWQDSPDEKPEAADFCPKCTDLLNVPSRAFLFSKETHHLLWRYDEGLNHDDNGISQNWWAQLNVSVGCGQPRKNYKKRRN